MTVCNCDECVRRMRDAAMDAAAPKLADGTAPGTERSPLAPDHRTLTAKHFEPGFGFCTCSWCFALPYYPDAGMATADGGGLVLVAGEQKDAGVIGPTTFASATPLLTPGEHTLEELQRVSRESGPLYLKPPDHGALTALRNLLDAYPDLGKQQSTPRQADALRAAKRVVGIDDGWTELRESHERWEAKQCESVPVDVPRETDGAE